MGGQTLRGLAAFDYVVGATRALVGFVLVAAGVAKLPARDELATTIRSYEILPPAWARPLSRILPALEVAAGATFAAGVLPVVTGSIAGALLVAFSVAVAVNLLRGRRSIDCGCFGSRSHGISWTIVARNAALAAAALWAASVPAPPGLDTTLPTVLVAGAAVAAWFAVRSVWALTRVEDVSGRRAATRAPDKPTALIGGMRSFPSQEGAE